MSKIPVAGGHAITLEKAVSMTTLYRTKKEELLLSAYSGQNILAISETFNRDAFDVLLAQKGAAGIRLYHGMDEALKIHAIFVAVNAANEDILSDDSGEQANDAPQVMESGQRCPTICSDPSPLNP